MNNGKKERFEFFLAKEFGKRKISLCTCSSAEEAARLLLNSRDERDIESINVIIERLLETGEEQIVSLDVDCAFGDGERLKNRCLIGVALA